MLGGGVGECGVGEVVAVKAAACGWMFWCAGGKPCCGRARDARLDSVVDDEPWQK